jgi:LuxR family maltose regulon positive regulatory protein
MSGNEATATPRRDTRRPADGGRRVARPRLLRLLDDGAGAVLTLVAAPAGFGKTTLLHEWAAARPGAVLVPLRPRDAEPAALWVDVLRALDAPAGIDATPEAAAAFVAGRHGGALVLDGYEAIASSPEAEASLWRFATERPWSYQLVIGGRREPAFPLASLRARGELVEIRSRELRLTDAEARQLVAVTRRLAPADVDDLLARCGGWAAALALAVDGGSLTVGDAALRDLVLQLLADRDDERQLLVECSILEDLSPALCDAVTGRRRSAELLGRIERDNLFVEPAGDGGVLRLHPAARRVLRAELDRTAPRAVPRLHRRAAAWYRATGGRPQLEVEHMLACGDVHGAAVRIGRVWPQLAGAGKHARALAWLDRLPADPGDARLALARGWLLRLDGRRDESDAWLDAARRAAPARARAAVVRSCALARAVLPWDDVGEAMALARRAWRSERGGARRAVAAWALGWSEWWSGDDGAAEAALADARTGPPVLSIAATSVLARIALERGDLAAAGDLADAAAAAVTDAGLDELPALGMVATAAGAVAAERGEGESALALLERGVRLRRTWGHPLETADALLVAAPVAAALHGRRSAAALLAEARLLVAACPDAGVLQARLAAASRTSLPRPAAYRSGDRLTSRERMVLRLLARGRSKREIADELNVSFNTVHSHTKAIYRKLGASSRDEAIERMRELGLY